MDSREDNIVLGAGEIYFDQFTAGTKTKTGERYTGASQGLNITGASEKLDHYNSERGIRTKDVSVVTEVNYTGSMILDSINPSNLAAFFLGEVGSSDQGVATVTDEELTVLQDRHYQLGVTTDLLTGVRNVTSVVVTDDTGVTTYVEDTDYTVDLALGRIYIIPGGDIADGAAEDILVDYDTAAESRERVISSGTEIEGAIRWVAYNAQGLLTDYYLPWVKLSPNGDLALKGEEWQQVNLNIEILQLNSATPHVFAEVRNAS